MADQNDRAFEFQQDFFKQLEGFDIKIVGGFIEDEQIGRPGEEARQNRPIDLPAGQGFDRGSDAIRGK